MTRFAQFASTPCLMITCTQWTLRFHSRCVIQWMQRGNLSCPTCRRDHQDHSQSIPSFALFERASHIRRTLGRRVNAPSSLKRLIKKLKDAPGIVKELTDTRECGFEKKTDLCSEFQNICGLRCGNCVGERTSANNFSDFTRQLNIPYQRY